MYATVCVMNIVHLGLKVVRIQNVVGATSSEDNSSACGRDHVLL